MGSFQYFSTKTKHREPLTIYQLKSKGSLGLNVETPGAFVTPPKQEAAEPRLNRKLAFYMAHAMRNQQTILEKQLWNDIVVTCLLYLLARDSEEEADATEFDSVFPATYKAGKATFEEQYKYYAGLDNSVLSELDRLISDEYFYDNNAYRYFHTPTGRATDFRFVSETGKHKLKHDWPHIWKSFELDIDRPREGAEVE
jgi:hypothetical protein